MTEIPARAAAPTGLIRTRPVSLPAEIALRSAGLHPLLARLYAARGLREPADARLELDELLRPGQLLHCERAAILLADAIAAGSRLVIVADYDCDGATACAVGLQGLRAMGATVDYVVPDRFRLGYGLSPGLVEECRALSPDLLITVDNGIASVEGVAAAKRLGIATLVTDHHLPGQLLPEAECIVNPNQPGCTFPSKAIAGVGVMFYVLLALRSELRRRGAFGAGSGPRLAELLPLVALGTVADVVPLDRNNRILVSEGLRRIRAGQMPAGLRALFAAAGRDSRRAGTQDIGFSLAPRLNAAGRLDDMRIGIELLMAGDETVALELAQRLDQLNAERRSIQSTMSEQAAVMLPRVDAPGGATVTLYDPSWHQGVVGILAGRIKDQLHRPTFVFAPADADAGADPSGQAGELRGSGRSIAGLHLRDCLDLVDKASPGLLVRFGGHAAAAGATLHADRLAEFTRCFEEIASRMIDPAILQRQVITDGPLEAAYLSVECARMMEAEVWGQGFAAPLFSDRVTVQSQRLVGGKHTRMKLRVGGTPIDAIQFNSVEPLPAEVLMAFRLGIDEYNGLARPQLVIEAWEPVA
jgi:single-stranded-DNA-specific exonuclease